MQFNLKSLHVACEEHPSYKFTKARRSCRLALKVLKLLLTVRKTVMFDITTAPARLIDPQQITFQYKNAGAIRLSYAIAMLHYKYYYDVGAYCTRA